MGQDGVVDVVQGARRQRQPFDALAGDGFDHPVQDKIAIAEVMMERDGHAVFQAGGVNRLLQRGQHFVRRGILRPQAGSGHPSRRLECKGTAVRTHFGVAGQGVWNQSANFIDHRVALPNF